MLSPSLFEIIRGTAIGLSQDQYLLGFYISGTNSSI